MIPCLEPSLTEEIGSPPESLGDDSVGKGAAAVTGGVEFRTLAPTDDLQAQ